MGWLMIKYIKTRTIWEHRPAAEILNHLITGKVSFWRQDAQAMITVSKPW